MSWFTFNAIDTKPIVRELKRIADMMEVRLRIEHNYHMTVPQSEPAGVEPDTVTYASDAELAKQELREEIAQFEALADEVDRDPD